MIDTHCHFEIESENLEQELQEIFSSLDKIIVSCCTKEEIKINFSKLKNKDSVFFALGYHPEEAGKIQEEDFKQLEKLLQEKKVVALGEIGLDYHYTKEKKEEQKDLFEKQLHLAKKYHLPVVIHSRDATEDTIQILRKYDVKGVIHCFNGSLETANIYIKMGYKLGIGGVVTFQNSKLKDVVQSLPISSIVLETDSPYLAPIPYRGKKNSPKYLGFIAEKIAEIKEISKEQVIEQTTLNAREIFDFSS